MRRLLIFILFVLISGSSLFLVSQTYEQYAYEHGLIGPSPDNPPPGGDRGPSTEELQSELDNLENSESNVENADSEIEAGDGDLMEQANENAETDVAEANAKTEKAENDSQKKQESNTKKNTDKKDSKNSNEKGDPVKITEGCYVQSDLDLSVNGHIPIEVKRTYKSNSKIISLFGYGWSFNYDERIVRGCNADVQIVADEYEKNISTLEKILAIYETQFFEVYKVSSFENAVSEINNKISACNDNLSKINMIKIQALSLENYMRNSSLSSDFSNYLLKLDELENKIKSKIEVLKKNLNRIEKDIAFIDELKKVIYENQLKLESKKTELVKYQTIKNQNKNVMFEGMDESFEETGYESITYIDENDYPHLLYETYDGSLCWNNPADKSIEKIVEKDNKFQAFFSNGIIKDFNEAGFLEKITDRNENYLCIKRNDKNKIINICNSDGEIVEITYENGFISSVSNSRDKTEKVCYSHKGNKLTKVIDSENDAVNLEYDEKGLLVKLTKCDGTSIKFSYGEESSDGKILTTATTNENGKSEYFIYNREEKVTKYINHDGDETIIFYDDKHRTIKQINPDGSEIENKFDDDGNLIETKQNGDAISYVYDSNGNLIRSIFSDYSSENYFYNSYNQILEIQDRDGMKTEYSYDEKGNLTDYCMNETKIFHQVFDKKGNVIKYVEYAENPIIKDYGYDSWGNLISEKIGDSKTEFEYDSRNRVIKIKQNGIIIDEYFYQDKKIIERKYNGLETVYVSDGRKDVVEILQKDLRTGKVIKNRFEYDGRHLPVKIYEGDGINENIKEGFAYTPEGKIKAKVLYARNDENNYITLLTYKNGEICKNEQFLAKGSLSENPEEIDFESLKKRSADKVFSNEYEYQNGYMNKKRIVIRSGNNSEQFFDYDSFGNLVGITDENGEIRKKEYSCAGRLKKEQQEFGGWYCYAYDSMGFMDGAGEENAGFVKVIYNPNGTVRKKIDRYGNEEDYSYDNLGRITCIKNNKKSIWYTYDYFGRVIEEIVGDYPSKQSAVYYLKYEYFDDERKVVLTEGGKYVTEYELDAFGNVVSEIDGNGNKKLYEYNNDAEIAVFLDGYNNQTEYTYNALGKIIRIKNPDESQIEYKYNFLGLISKITDDEGIVYSAEYDNTGHLVSEQKRSESKKEYKYDKKGRICEIISGGEIIEKYEYDEYGCNVSVQNGNGFYYSYDFDNFGRLIGEKNPKGDIKQYFYDEEGALKSQKDFDGESSYIVYSCDRKERKVLYPDGEMNRFLYNPCGKIVEAENRNEKIVFEYDQGGQLVKQSNLSNGEVLEFEYDSAKNRIKVTSSKMDTVFRYGKNGEIIEVFDNKQRVGISLKYDKCGREIERKFANGTVLYQEYDKAGRVVLIKQTGVNREIIWAEGYVYDSNGKRQATVDLNGRVTLYKYNVRGQIEKVSYPYSEERALAMMKEAGEYGITTVNYCGENDFLSASLKEKIVLVMNKMGFGYGNKLTSVQVFINESYEYDKNGNRISKTTPLGTIYYKYDNENRLVESGANGKSVKTYKYDKKGNLIAEESLWKKAEYKYNAQNRLVFSQVIDKNDKKHDLTVYWYDAIGRRSLIQNSDGQMISSVYDGFSFNLIRQSPVMKNGMYVNSEQIEYFISKNGTPTGDRYRYLENNEDEEKYENRYVYLDDGNYKYSKNRYLGERILFSVNDKVVVQKADESTGYFTGDLQGSIRLVLDSEGHEINNYSYDVFGSPVEGNLSGPYDFGYLGKQFDFTTNSYYYGYRDYEVKSGRFMTVDPVRDGENWYLYCGGDPVNFVDLWGLEIMNFGAYSSMSKFSDKINETDCLISDYGCAMTGMANIITEINYVDNHNLQAYNSDSHEGAIKVVTPIDINVSDNFVGNTAYINWNATANSYGLTAERSGSKNEAQQMIENASKSSEQEYMLIQVPVTIGSGDSKKEILHWVGNSGKVIQSKGQEWIEIIPTSDNDAGRDKKNSNWMQKDGKMYVKKTAVEGAVVVKKKNK